MNENLIELPYGPCSKLIFSDTNTTIDYEEMGKNIWHTYFYAEMFYPEIFYTEIFYVNIFTKIFA